MGGGLKSAWLAKKKKLTTTTVERTRKGKLVHFTTISQIL